MYSEKLQYAIELRDTGHVPEAVEELRAIASQTDDLNEKIQAFGNLVVCYRLLGSLSDARAAWQNARELASSTTEVQPDLDLYINFLDACLLNEEGKIEEASKKFTRLFHDYADAFKSPENRELYEDIQHRRANTLIELGRFREALPLLEEVITFDLPPSDKIKLLCHLGDCCIDIEDYESARRHYESAQEMGMPKEWESRSRYYLGIAYAKLDLFHKAKQEFEFCESKLAGYDLPLRDLYKWLAFVSKRLGETDKVREYTRLSLTA